jgi:hypothetical protein
MRIRTASANLTALLLLCSTSLAREAPEGMVRFNELCPAERLAKEFDRSYHQCKNGYENGSCNRFIKFFQELLPEYDCQRPIDSTPTKKYVVPAIWLLGDAEHEDYVQLLSSMKQAEARTLFASKEFRTTLDGALAERFWAASERTERQLKRAAAKK